MKDLELDFFNKTVKNSYIDNENRVLQQIRLAVQIWIGDWFLDDEFGIDYSTAYGNRMLMDSFMKYMIGQVEGVLNIESFKIVKKPDEFNKETYFIDTKIMLDNGIILSIDEQI